MYLVKEAEIINYNVAVNISILYNNHCFNQHKLYISHCGCDGKVLWLKYTAAIPKSVATNVMSSILASELKSTL